MKNILVILVFLAALSAPAQENRGYNRYMDPNDSLLLVNLPVLELPESYKGLKSKDLPDYHDNSQNEFFRPIFNQFGWSCGQASSIGYNFTYEMNRFNNTSALVEDNQYPPIFAFNFFNDGQDGVGVSYMYSFEALRSNGTPNVTDYGGMGSSLVYWPDGYEVYYNGMFNKIDQVYSIHVGDEEGLLTLKHYMYDHLEGSATGGIANFYTDLYSFTTLPAGTPEAGKAVITAFGPYNGHSMTFLGWNDSIRWDYNGDGQYTNDLDINNDGEVTMKDWEIGGVILANSWGDDWADSGFCYVMYNVLAMEKLDGGIWNKMVNVLTLKEDYQPLLTYKVKLTHDSRNKIKVVAGISTDTASSIPQHKLEFPIFNFQGGDHYMQGDNSSNDNKTLEFGLDVTPLLSHVEPGSHARFYLQVIENDPDALGTGMIDNFSVMDYTAGGLEVECMQTNVPLVENGTTSVSVVHSLSWDDVEITNDELPAFLPGQPFSAQMTATGGTAPYAWEIAPVYSRASTTEDYVTVSGQQLYPTSNQSGFATKAIEFQFPFFDRLVDTVHMYVDGFLKFDGNPYPLPYQVEDMLVFKNEAVVAGFLNQDMLVNVSGGNKLWYEGDEDHASFRWQAEIAYGNNSYPVDVTATLYPDGRIEIGQDAYAFPGQVQKITGISAGDGINFFLESPLFTEESLEDRKLIYTPLNYPAEISIGESGMLSCSPPDDSRIYSVSVRATDNSNISDTRLFQLSSGIIYDHEVQSGDDAQIDYGETVYLGFTVKNIGGVPLNEVQITVDCEDPIVDWIDNTEYVENLVPGESVVLPAAVSFEMNSAYPDGYGISLTLTFAADEGQWESRITLTAYAPALVAGVPVIEDGDNNRLDPGETTEVTIPVINTGVAMAEGVQGLLYTDDPFITIEGPALVYGNIPGGGTATDAVNLTVDETTPQGHMTTLFLDITAEPDIQITNSISLLVGRYPVLVVDMDPELLSGPFIAEALEQLEVNHDYNNLLPSNLEVYQNIFVVLGRNFGQHVLTQAEGQKLAGFLEAGGNIYMEGGLTWWDDPQTAVHPMFSLEAQYTGWTMVDTAVGSAGTFLDSLRFDYLGDVMYYNNHLVPQAGAYTVLHANGEEHNFTVAYEGENYKTVGSILDFGGLVDGPVPSTRYHLMGRILEFFGVEVVITTMEETPVLSGNHRLHPNPARDLVTLQLAMDQPGRVTVALFDARGVEVMKWADNEALQTGRHTLAGDVSGLPAGVYTCLVMTSGTAEAIKLIVTD